MKDNVVYNVDTGETEIFKCLRMNNIHHYNSTMVNVDPAGQMRGSYRVDHWLRNRKWLWLLLF